MQLTPIVGVIDLKGGKARWVAIFHSSSASVDPEDCFVILANKGSGFEFSISLADVTKLLQTEGKTDLLEQINDAFSKAKLTNSTGRRRTPTNKQLVAMLGRALKVEE